MVPTATGMMGSETVSSTPSASAKPVKNRGPVIRHGVTAVGLDLPRLLPPDLQDEVSADAGAAGCGFFVGPVAGQLGLPCSAFNLA